MIPSEIKIGGKIIKIMVVDNADMLQPDNASSNWGMARYDEGVIAIKKLKSVDEMQEVLCHEIKHFFDVYAGRKMYLTSKEVDYELQNVMTDNVFWQFLKDNTNFFNSEPELVEVKSPKGHTLVVDKQKGEIIGRKDPVSR